ncbi:FAD-binding oxidoreductase, partial [Mycobacteroides immunogenum]
CGGVAVGGNCLGGGAGLLARSHGWLTQSIRSLEVVDAEGEILTVDSEHHPDLFWGLRGAGGNNFGVVTSLTFQAYRLPTLTQGLIRWDWEHFVEVADAFQRWLPTLDSRVNTVAHLERKELGFVAINVISLLPHAETETAVAPLLDALPPIIDQKYVATAYADAVHEAIDPEMLYSKAIRATTLMGSALGPLSRGVLEKLKNRLAVGRGETALYLYGLGGADGVAAQRHRADPVSLPHVNALLAPYTRIYWTDPAEDEYNLAWMAGLGKDILPSLDATYINSHDIHVDDRVYPRYGESFARLVDIKRQYDPSNLFSFQASIPPSLSREEAITLGLPESQIKEAQERGLLSS